VLLLVGAAAARRIGCCTGDGRRRVGATDENGLFSPDTRNLDMEQIRLPLDISSHLLKQNFVDSTYFAPLGTAKALSRLGNKIVRRFQSRI